MPKVRASFLIPDDLIERVRDAVVSLSGPPHQLTLAKFAEQALEHELERLQDEHNGGKPFAHRAAQVRPGRPIAGRPAHR